MVAIVGGSGLGLFNSSLGVLGGQGGAGNASLGRSGESVYVNATTGNLIIQRQDEFLSGKGPDLSAFRTYNSLGQFSDDNGDNWRLSFSRRIHGLNGIVNTINSTVLRTGEDGAETVYRYDEERGSYISTDGGGAFDSLSYDSVLDAWIWADGDSRNIETYDANNGGRLVKIADIDGNAITLDYNDLGLISAITSANGEVTYIDYDNGTSNISQLRTVNSNAEALIRVRYSYDAANRLSQVITDLTPDTTADNADVATLYITAYTYDGSSNRIASIEQSDGTRLEFTYVHVGSDYRLETVRDVRSPTDIRTTSFIYDIANNATTITDALGQLTKLTYDAQGQLLSVTSPAVNGMSQQVRFEYDSYGNLSKVTDARGNSTVYEYDENGNRVSERDSKGNTVTRTYGINNQLLTETSYAGIDPDGIGPQQPSQPMTTRYVYDEEGHLRFRVSAEGRVSEYRYQANGQLCASIQYTEAVYHLVGLSTEQVLGESELETWKASANKSQSTRIDYAYDFRGQLEKQTTYAEIGADGIGITAGASTTQYVYSQDGQLLQVIDPRGAATAQSGDFTATYTYDGLGRQTSARDANGVLTLTSYDDINRKTVITFANGQTTTTTYDQAGRAISVAQGNALNTLGTTSYIYDKLDRLRMSIDPTGQKRFYVFDEAGRQVGEVDSAGAFTEYRYNANNQVAAAIRYATPLSENVLSAAAADPLSFTIAAANLTPSQNDRITRNIYNPAGQLSKTVDAEGSVIEFEYDGAGRQIRTTRYATVLSQIQLNELAILALQRELAPDDVLPVTNPSADRIERSFYNAEGLLAGKLDAEGYLVEYQYDGAGRLVHTIGYATPVESALQAGGTLEQLTPVSDGSNDQHTYLLYDARGQLEGKVDAEGYLTEWRYDAAGNKTYVARYATKVSHQAGADVAMLKPVATSEDQVIEYAYNELNQLVQKIDVDRVTTETYAYDALGRQTSSTRAANDAAQARTSQVRYDDYGRVAMELGGVGSAAIAALGVEATQAQIDAVWAKYAVKYAYDAANRRISTTDALENTTLSYYDAQGRISHTINAAGEVSAILYNSFGEVAGTRAYTNRLSASLLATLTGGIADLHLSNVLSTLESTSDRIESTIYTRRGQVLQRLDALGHDAVYAYNAFGQVESVDQKLNEFTRRVDRYGYDRRGLLEMLLEDEGAGKTNRNTHNVYDAFGRKTQYIDGNGKLWATGYDRLGRVISTADPLNATRITTYDAHSRVLAQTNALGQATTYSYDTNNRSLTVTTPEGISTTTVKNAHGEVVTFTDGRENSTSFHYNANGELLRQTNAAGTTSNVFDEAGRRIETTDILGTKTVFVYDAVGRILTRTVDPSSAAYPQGLNLTTAYEYDGQGRVVRQTDESGVVTQTAYDAKGQVASIVVDPDGLALTTKYTYDAEGRSISVTEGYGSSNERTTVYVYDGLGRRIEQIVDPGGVDIRTAYHYDANNNVIAKTDANSHVTRFAFDAANRLEYTVDATGAVTRHIYDAQGNLNVLKTFATSVTTAGWDLAVDATEIAARIIPSASDRETRYVYDDDNRLTFTLNANGYVTEQIYDANGNVVKVIDYANPVGIPTSDEDSIRDAILISSNDRVTRTVYDKANRAVASLDAEGYLTTRRYDGAGHVLQAIRYAERYSLTDFETPESLQEKLPSSVPESAVVESYAYDTAGRLITTIDGAGYVTHRGYDEAGRLTDVTQAYGTSQSKTVHTQYDSAGRVIAQTDAYGTDLAATTEYTLDALGNRIAVKDTRGYITQHQFDAAGRITHVTDPQGHTIVTVYDALGHAVKVTDQLGNSGYFYFDGAGRATLHVDPEGYTTETKYDAFGGAVEIIRYATPVSTPYDAVTRPSLSSNSQDAVTRLEHDKLGRQTKITDAEGYSETMVYDGFGNKSSYTNKLGGTYTYTYDKRGKVLTEVLPSGITSGGAAIVNAFEYDARGNITRKIEASGLPEERVTTFQYDHLDRQIAKIGETVSVYDPSTGLTQDVSPTETTVYDAVGNVIETVDANGARTLTYYDARNRKIAVVSPIGMLTEYAYDAAGNILSERRYGEPVVLPTIGGNRPVPIDETNYRETHYEYDANNRHTTTTIKNVAIGERDPSTGAYNAIAADLITRKVYDAAGNVIQEIDARGSSIYRYYDRLGRAIAQVDQENYLSTSLYGAGDQAIRSVRYATKLAIVLTAETTLQVILANKVVNADHDRVTETDYDRMERVTETRVLNVEYGTVNGTLLNTTAGGIARTRYAYNGLGAVLKRTDALGAVTDMAYDVIGRLTREQNPTFTDFQGDAVRPTTDYEYDGLNQTRREIQRGKLANTEADDRITTYSYGAGGRLKSETDPTGATRHYQYDAAGRMVRTTIDRKDADGVTHNDATILHYNAQGQEIKRSTLTKLATSSAWTTLETKEIRYNIFGDITGKRINGGGLDAEWQETAEFDRAGRAWKSNSKDGAYQVFLYDANGNATLSIRSGGPDLKNLSFDEVMALPGAQIHLTISAFDKRNQLIGTYEPAMTGSRETAAIGQFITQQTGESFSGGAVSIGAVLTPYNKPKVTPVAAGGSGALGSTFSTTVSLGSTYFKDYYRRDFETGTKYYYHNLQSGAGDTVRFNIDTRSLGDGEVIINFSLAGYGGFGGHNVTLTLTAAQAASYVYSFNEATAGRLSAAPTYLTNGRSYSYTVTKRTAQGNISLGSYSGSIAYTGVSSATSGSDIYYYYTYSGSQTALAPKIFAIREQSAAATRLVLQYRPVGTDAGWQLMNVPRLTNSAGSVMAGWFGFNWGSWDRGNYEFNYVALDANDKVLNSQTGTFRLIDNTAPTMTQTTRPIGGAGRVFMDSAGRLHITEQGEASTSMKLRYRRPDGVWSSPITVPIYQLAGDNINGWFVFNAAASGLSGTYEYMVEAFNGSQVLTNRAQGIFTLGEAITDQSSGIEPVGIGAAGILGNPFSSSVSLNSTYFMDYYRRDYETGTKYYYHNLQSGGSDAVSFALDTRALGGGNVRVDFVLDGLGGFSGHSATLMLTAQQALSYTYAFNEAVAGRLAAAPTYLTNSRQYRYTVTKQTANGDVVLGTYYGTIQYNSKSTSTSGSDQYHAYAYSGSTVDLPPKILAIREQPLGTTRVVMQYRPAGSGAAWMLYTLPQLKTTVGAAITGAYGFNWSSWDLGSYEFNYVALDENDKVLNSQAGTFKLTSTISTITQKTRTIGGAGRVFTDNIGRLHITEQGETAVTLKLRFRRAGESWSAPVDLPRYYISNDPINGWFFFDANNTGLSGTYEYMVEAYDANSAMVNRAEGIFTYAQAISGEGGMLPLITGASGVTGNKFITTATLRSTYFMDYYRRDYETGTKYYYHNLQSGGGDAITFKLDTAWLGDGAVKIDFKLNALGGFGGHTASFTVTSQQALSYTYNFDEAVAGRLSAAPTYLTSGRSYTYTVTKKTAQGDVVLGTYNGTVAYSSNSLTTSGSDKYYAYVYTGTSVGQQMTGTELTIRGQPESTTRLLLQYRPAGSDAGWQLMSVPPMKNSSGVIMPGWFSFNWNTWNRGTYEFNYVALDASDKVLNSQTGTFTLSDNAASMSQKSRTIGGAGRVFMDYTQKLHITEQGVNATSLKIRYRRPDGVWSAQVNVPMYQIAGDPINGWFVFNPASYGLSGTYQYEVQAFDVNGAVLNTAQGSFIYEDPTLVGYQDNPAVIHFTSQPMNAETMVVYYRPAGSEGEFQTASAQKMIAGGFDWNASNLVLDPYSDYRYEYRYCSYDANGLLVNEASGIAQVGAHPKLESHINGYITPTQVTFNVPHATARGLALYYRLAGSQGDYTTGPIITRGNTNDPFSWNASSLVTPGTSATLEYYYELLNEAGERIVAEGDVFDDSDNEIVRVYGTVVIGEVAGTEELNWIVTGSSADAITISRTQRYNAFGEVVEEIDGNGYVTNLNYNALGRLTVKRDPETNVTLANGYVKRERPVTRYAYDLAGRLVGVIDANGNATKQTLVNGTGIDGNEAALVLDERHADGGERSRRYDVFGDLRFEDDEINRRTQYEYDKASRITKVTRPATAADDLYQYDALGNRISHTDALNHREKTYYDGLGRVTATVSAAGFETSYDYVYRDDITGVGGAKIGGYQKTTTFAYGRNTVEQTDYFNHMSWRKDLGGHTYQYTFNAAGWLEKQTSSAGQNIEYLHYANGFIKSIVDKALKTATSYEYDREGNRTREVYKHQIGANNWAYDQNSEIFYDELNRMIRVLDPRADIRYQYDANGNRRRVWSYYHDGINGKKTTQDYWYAYDTMNRFVITMGKLSGAPATSATATGTSIILGTTGVSLAYNAAGERVMATYGEDGHVERYTYSANGNLERTYMKANANAAEVLAAERIEDLMGRVATYKEWDSAGNLSLLRTSEYDNDSKVLSQTEKQYVNGTLKAHTDITNYYSHSGAGPTERIRQLQHALVENANDVTVDTYYTYEWWDEAKESKLTIDPYNKDFPKWVSGYADFKYDVNGHLVQVDDPSARQTGMGRTIRYRTDAQGLIVQRVEIAGGTANAQGEVVDGQATMTHNFYYIDGHRIGDVGNDGNLLKTSGKSYAEDLSKYSSTKKKDEYRNWKPVASADFDQNYQPVNAHYPSHTPGSFTVRAGDTLQSIAASVWGDASMWYLIADANGLTGADALAEGQVLTIPNKITNIHNNSSTFKVYNAGEALGDTSPTLPEAPTPPKPKKSGGGCGGFLKILIAVVAIVATVFTAGVAAIATGAVASTTGVMTAGAAVLTGGAVGGAALVGGFGIAALSSAVIGGALGSVISQGIGIAVGAQDKFSWSAVGKAGISAGISAGVGAGLKALGWVSTATSSLEAMRNAAITSTVTQGINVATGLQKKFDWKGVAVSAVSAGIGYGLNELIGEAQYGADGWKEVLSGARQDTLGNMLVRDTLKGIGTGAAQSAMYGNKPNWGAIAADSFGQTLGNTIVESYAIKERAIVTERILKNQGISYEINEDGTIVSESHQQTLTYVNALARSGATDADILELLNIKSVKAGLKRLDFGASFGSNAETKEAASRFVRSGGSVTSSQLSDYQGIEQKIDESTSTSNSNAYSGYAENGDKILPEVVVTALRAPKNDFEVAASLLKGGIQLGDSLIDVYSNHQRLAGLAYIGAKAVLGGGPVKTTVFEIGRVAVGDAIDSFTSQLSGYLQEGVSDWVTGWAHKNNVNIGLQIAGRNINIGPEVLGFGAGQLAGMVGDAVLGSGNIGNAVGRAKNVRGVVQHGRGHEYAVHSRYPDGTTVIEKEQPGKIDGHLSESPHTVLQMDEVNNRIYKAREYGENGIPIRDIDFTHPTYPSGKLRPDHTVPEQHKYIPNDPNNPKAGHKRGPGEPFLEF